MGDHNVAAARAVSLGFETTNLDALDGWSARRRTSKNDREEPQSSQKKRFFIDLSLDEKVTRETHAISLRATGVRRQ